MQKQKVLEQELLPRLRAAGGLLRYTTLLLNDGRVGSVSTYEDKEAADRGRQIGRDWMHSTDIMSNYKPAESYEGEVVYMLTGEDLQPGAYGVARIYDTDASSEAVRAATEELAGAIQAVPGFMHLTAVMLPGQGVAVLTTFKTLEGASQLTENAKEARAVSGSSLQKVFPEDPESIEARVLGTYT